MANDAGVCKSCGGESFCSCFPFIFPEARKSFASQPCCVISQKNEPKVRPRAPARPSRTKKRQHRSVGRSSEEANGGQKIQAGLPVERRTLPSLSVN